MGRYVVRRLLQMVLVLFGASIILFASLYVLPGDPVATQQGEGHQLDATSRTLLERRYHLDESLPSQYLNYVSRLLHGDMGESYTYRRSVNEVIGEKLGNTVRLALAAFAIIVVIGVIAGVVAAVFRYSFLDVMVTLATTVAVGIPVFVVGLGLQQIFAIGLGWFPLQGTHGPRSLVLPALTLAAVETALVARLMRGSMLEVMRSDYIRTATAKGLTKRAVTLKHGLRNSIIPVITYLGICLGTLLGGALVTETIFNWDGVGLALVNAIQTQDNPVVLGVVTYAVAVFVLVNLVVDLSYAVLDPRIRLS